MRAIFGLLFIGSISSIALAGPPVLQPRAGDPLPDLTPGELARFEQGLIDYKHDFTEAEGLGPIHNETSCSSCHSAPVGGTGSQFVVRAGSFSKIDGFDPLADLGGSLFQRISISPACMEVVPFEATVVTERVTPGMMGYGLVEAIPDADIQDLADNQPAGLSGRTNIDRKSVV